MSASKAKQECRRSRCATPAKTEYSCTRGPFCAVCTIWGGSVQSAYRGLGSIDFRAAARSVLLIGRVKREPNVRVIVHDKSSLAPEGKPVAFCLDPETGFSWIGEYDITADELLSGAGGNTATKTEQAEKLILDLLADGKELASEDIVKAAAEAGISERTVKNARRNLDTRIEVIRRGNQWYYRRNEAKSAK